MNHLIETFLGLEFLVSERPCHAERHNPNTDWFKDAKSGIFLHFRPGNAKQFAEVPQFDVQYVAKQLEDAGAKSNRRSATTSGIPSSAITPAGADRCVNQPGHNDIVVVKVSGDALNMYFIVRTREPLTPGTDPNWMRLFVDAEPRLKAELKPGSWSVPVRRQFSAAVAPTRPIARHLFVP